MAQNLTHWWIKIGDLKELLTGVRESDYLVTNAVGPLLICPPGEGDDPPQVALGYVDIGGENVAFFTRVEKIPVQ